MSDLREIRDELARKSVDRILYELHEADGRERHFKMGFDAAIEHLGKECLDEQDSVLTTELKLQAKIAIAIKALKDANDNCRSALSIASREGRETNWSPFRERLNESLALQHEALKKIGCVE